MKAAYIYNNYLLYSSPKSFVNFFPPFLGEGHFQASVMTEFKVLSSKVALTTHSQMLISLRN